MAASGRRQAELAVAQVGCAQPGVERRRAAARWRRTRRPVVATALRSSVRISVATGSAVGGQQRVDVGDQQHAAAVAHRRHRRRDALEPVLGAQRARPRGRPVRPAGGRRTPRAPAWPCRRRRDPTPARRDWAWRPGFRAARGSSSASLSHSVSLPACAWEPLRSSMSTGRRLLRGDHGVLAAVAACGDGATPSPQLTTEFGCTLTGPGGIDAGDRQQLRGPGDADGRRQRAAGRRRRDVRARVRAAAATPCRRPSSPCRAAPGAASPTRSTGWPDSIRVTVTDRAPYTVTGATSTVVSSRSPALDSVTSSSSAVPAGVSGRRHPDHRGGGARTGQRHRIPLPNTQGGNGFRMQPDHAAARVQCRGVQPRGERELMARRRAVRDVEPGHVTRPGGLRSPSRAIDRRCGWAGAPADRPPRLRVAPWACRPTPRGASTSHAWFGPRTGCG